MSAHLSKIRLPLLALGMLALAAWLLRYDVARYTLRKSGLTRFIALCLLLGYGRLGVSGILAIWLGGVSGGFYYDALLHALFVGFVLSMIFGHAPIIFPAIVGRAMPFRPHFYSHLALLHLSLLLRVGGRSGHLATGPLVGRPVQRRRLAAFHRQHGVGDAGSASRRRQPDPSGSQVILCPL